MMVAISVYFQTSGNLQAYMALALVTVCLMVHIHHKPFAHRYSNILEFVSLCISFLTFFFGTLLFSPYVRDYARVAISIIIVVMNVAFVLGAAGLILAAARYYWQQKQQFEAKVHHGGETGDADYADVDKTENYIDAADVRVQTTLAPSHAAQRVAIDSTSASDSAEAGALTGTLTQNIVFRGFDVEDEPSSSDDVFDRSPQAAPQRAPTVAM